MVTEVQYGGRITDGLDRELFNDYGNRWINENCLTQNYCFDHTVTEFNYHIPDYLEHQRFVEYIGKMPGNDSPNIFGLHANADLTFRLKESLEMINVLLDTQPKEAGGAGGLSREDQVKEKIEKELLPKLPQDFIMLDVIERLKVLKGPKGLVDAVTGKYDTVPLNVFLRQEIEWF
jgi:dynein heavy chain